MNPNWARPARSLTKYQLGLYVRAGCFVRNYQPRSGRFG